MVFQMQLVLPLTWSAGFLGGLIHLLVPKQIGKVSRDLYIFRCLCLLGSVSQAPNVPRLISHCLASPPFLRTNRLRLLREAHARQGHVQAGGALEARGFPQAGRPCRRRGGFAHIEDGQFQARYRLRGRFFLKRISEQSYQQTFLRNKMETPEGPGAHIFCCIVTVFLSWYLSHKVWLRGSRKNEGESQGPSINAEHVLTNELFSLAFSVVVIIFTSYKRSTPPNYFPIEEILYML